MNKVTWTKITETGTLLACVLLKGTSAGHKTFASSLLRKQGEAEGGEGGKITQRVSQTDRDKKTEREKREHAF